MSTRSEHWNGVYARRSPQEVSWFQAEACTSLELIEASGCSVDAGLIDVGAGASTLVDGLLARGFRDITLLDIAETAFADTRRRLPDAKVQYVVSDITAWAPTRTFDVWHDRAVFHFLTGPRDRAAYRAALVSAVPPGGHVIIGTFASDGPERCSSLPVQRYSAEELAREFRAELRAVETRSERHATPGGSSQSFVFVRFLRP
ncbi:MAG TPA: class I SAM-dependent methyltransferase [Polyangiaceae bacterium]|nr:class I SAM-dependent methyltransferase [Polyangiaceae bacterium]